MISMVRGDAKTAERGVPRRLLGSRDGRSASHWA
jgi:hypothetical protein